MNTQLPYSRGEGEPLLLIPSPAASFPTSTFTPHFLRVVNVDIIGPCPVGNPR